MDDLHTSRTFDDVLTAEPDTVVHVPSPDQIVEGGNVLDRVTAVWGSHTHRDGSVTLVVPPKVAGMVVGSLRFSATFDDCQVTVTNHPSKTI